MWTHLQLLPVLESGEETLIGGQAVMEGVMMRAPHSYCIAVRRADGSVVYETKPLAKVSEKYPIFKLPMLRGLGTLGQAMSLGIKSLQYSANIAMEDEAKAEAAAKAGTTATMLAMNALAPGAVCASSAAGESGASKPFSNAMMAVQLIFSLGFFIVAYKLVPLWIATWFAKLWPVLEGRIAFNLVDGVIRILIFLCFLTVMSRMKDIRRVFEYHGGEHRVVFNFESGKTVDIPTAQSFPTFHPRCGTSFLITVMLISMVIYTLLPFDGFAAKFASRIVLLPVIAGLSYEIIRFAAKRKEGLLMQMLAAPGLWLQRITTQPPDDQQTDIAIKALAGAMEEEKRQGGQLVIA
ncbi:MAG: DUF1385 domain-containing protein [Bryobacterales bacterium]|nr:DUF1385 domain-containing protein [Bryobacterales bacterium]